MTAPLRRELLPIDDDILDLITSLRFHTTQYCVGAQENQSAHYRLANEAAKGIVSAFAAARKEERERCAVLAETAPSKFMPSVFDTAETNRREEATGRSIAAAIRALED